MSGELGESKDTRRVRASGRGPAPLGQLEASASSDWHVLWHDDKEALLDAGRRFEEYIQGCLKLELKPFCLNKNEMGLPFLGYLLYPETTRLAQRSRRRYIQKIRQYERYLAEGAWTQKEYQRHAASLAAFTEHADAKAFRQKVHQPFEI